jgi:MtfA peptidase
MLIIRAEGLKRRFWGTLAVASLCSIPFAVAGGPAMMVIPFVLAAAALDWSAFRRKHTRRLTAARKGLGADEREALAEGLAYYTSLDEQRRELFEECVAVFLYEHPVTGIDGVTVSARMCALIAGCAVRMVFERPEWEYPAFGEVLVYPSDFTDDGTFRTRTARGEDTVDGMTPSVGGVILSLPRLIRSFNGRFTGDLVYHEFAHIVDGVPGADGVPYDLEDDIAARWRELLDREFERAGRGGSALGSYAATHPAEFFAVSVEVFFTNPGRLSASLPEVSAMMVEIFRQDPASCLTSPEP